MIIDGRCNGPADSGNGGYTAGLVALALAPAAGSTAQVTLRVPPPLDTVLQPVRELDRLVVYHGDQPVAEAEPVPAEPATAGAPVPNAGQREADAAAAAYPGFSHHPFPTCYVCGPHRPAADGLGIFPGPLAPGRTAAGWQVPADVSVPTVWAALDCPGGWSVINTDPAGDAPARRYVLGRMAATVHRVPPAGSRCVLVGAVLGTERRKAYVASALYQVDGPQWPLASARATWIAT